MQKMEFERRSRTRLFSAAALTFVIAAPTLAQATIGKAIPKTIAAKVLASDRVVIKQRLDGMQRLWPVMLDLSKPADCAFYLAINRSLAGR